MGLGVLPLNSGGVPELFLTSQKMVVSKLKSHWLPQQCIQESLVDLNPQVQPLNTKSLLLEYDPVANETLGLNLTESISQISGWTPDRLATCEMHVFRSLFRKLEPAATGLNRQLDWIFLMRWRHALAF